MKGDTMTMKGPWKATKPNEIGDIFIRSHYEQGKRKGVHVADLIATLSCGLNEQQAANARLIAAAPELLAVAEMAEASTDMVLALLANAALAKVRP